MRLIAEGLGAERGDEPVFANLDFALGEGEALLVTGPNGAGKSTLLRVLCDLLPAAAGRVIFEGGGEAWPDSAAAAHYLGHLNGLKPALTVEENLRFWRDFLGEPHVEPDEALALVGLPEIGFLPYSYLSTGQKRRVAIARLLVSYRPIWLLDEPTAGLDEGSSRQFAALMRAHLDDGGIVVAATHVALGLAGAKELRLGGHPQ